MNSSAKLRTRLPFLFVALAPTLAGCHDKTVVVRDTVTIDGTFIDADGTSRPIHIEDQDAGLAFDADDKMGASFFIPTSDGGDIVFTVSTFLPDGDHEDAPLPVRICACRQADIQDTLDFGPWCEVDEQRLCLDVDARVTGSVDRSECNVDECADQVRVIITIPEGGDFSGTLQFTHDEDWELRDYHV